MKITELNDKSKLFERELLGKIFIHPKESLIASQIISDQDFYHFPGIFSTQLDCYLNDKNFISEIANKKIELSDFSNEFSMRSTEAIARDLKEISQARKINSLLEQSLENVPYSEIETFVSELQQNLISSISKKDLEQSGIKNIITDYKTLQDFYIQKFKNGSGIIGLSTGYDKLDAVIDGLRPEHLWIIGGYTNMGKSFASLNIMAHLVRQGKRVVFYSVEMGKHDILSRLLGILTQQNGVSILKGFQNKGLQEAFDLLEKSDSAIYGGKGELSEILLSMYEENLKQKVDLFIIDFIQIVTVKGTRSEYEQVTAVSLELQQIAKRIKAPVMALSQVSNDGAKNPDQDLMSFKGSGAIAAAADLAIEIVYDQEDKAERNKKIERGEPVYMKWKIRKNRHGRTGNISMTFTGKTGIFEQLRERTEEELMKEII